MGFVIVHPELGVYLGCCLGLGFWSKLDPVGQSAAVVFDSPEQAAAHVASWDDFTDNWTTHPVTPDKNGYASVAACVAAGLEGWVDEYTPTEGTLQ